MLMKITGKTDEKEVKTAKKATKVRKVKKKVTKKITKEPKKEKEWRLAGKKIFLTYSRCDLSLEYVYEQLINKLNHLKVTNFVLSIENHKDQEVKGTHIHAFLELVRRLDTINVRFFDIEVVNTSTGEIDGFHPNMVIAKYRSKVIEYVVKDVLNVEEAIGEKRLIISDRIRISLNNDLEMMCTEEIMLKLAEINKINDAMLLLKERQPATFMKSHVSIRRSLHAAYLLHVGCELKYNWDQFVVPKGLKEQMLAVTEKNQALVLLGDSATGKTAFMLAFIKEELGLNPLKIESVDGLRFFNPGVHTAILYDDVDFETLRHSRESLIHYLDCENSSTIRILHGTVSIPRGIPRFITSNRKLDHYIRPDILRLQEIQRRFKTIDIGNTKLYRVIMKDNTKIEE